MNWRLGAGAIAVAGVVGLAVGAVATLVSANGLLTSSTGAIPAIVTFLIVAVGLAGLVFLGGPSREWFGNPYW